EHRERKRKVRPLNKVQHSLEKGWKRLGSSHTTEIYETFEHWRNDYSPHEYDTAKDLVAVKHLGHPVDRPMDIRARPFILQWITPDRDPPKSLSANPRPVFRAEYRCVGNCSDLPPSDHDSSGPEESSQPPHKSKTSKRPVQQPPKDTDVDSDLDGDGKHKKRSCPSKVIIH
ncbi:hypothetical protein DFH07DRAFT_709716, partial [Mycena maculata]